MEYCCVVGVLFIAPVFSFCFKTLIMKNFVDFVSLSKFDILFDNFEVLTKIILITERQYKNLMLLDLLLSFLLSLSKASSVNVIPVKKAVISKLLTLLETYLLVRNLRKGIKNTYISALY